MHLDGTTCSIFINICTNTFLLENCVLLTFKWCFNLSFEMQLSLSTFLLSGGCWSRRRSFCLGKEQAQIAGLHGVVSYMLSVTLVQCIFEVLHNRVLRDCLTELNLNVCKQARTAFGISIFKSQKITMILSLKKLWWLIQFNDTQDFSQRLWNSLQSLQCLQKMQKINRKWDTWDHNNNNWRVQQWKENKNFAFLLPLSHVAALIWNKLLWIKSNKNKKS